MKKIISKKVGLVLLSILIIPLASCSGPSEEVDKKGVKEAANPYSFDDVIVKADMDIPDCELRQLSGRMVFVTSAHCPHCKKALPKLEKIVKERNLGDIYENVDTSTDEGREVLEGAGIRIQYVPTLILDCKAYVGGKYTDKYGDILSQRK
ncbi:MAG: thioredoxin family protein [Deltaproteobacteria bacterium]|jgi:thiol-disulfide isomerase/thioredoxin|nr:thioredoxin family protein [Deltaproteobacteria bacterium]